MNIFVQTVLSTVAILGTIVLIYFSFQSFIRTTIGKGAGCHNSNNSDCTHCSISNLKDNNKTGIN